MRGRKNIKIYPEQTVPQCICVSGKPREDCPYYELPYQPKMEYVNKSKIYEEDVLE